MRLSRYALITLFVIIASSASAQKKIRTDIRTLIIFFDGLRPDYITEEGMPNVYAFSKEAGYGKEHHSVFPTVTRVNGASYASGSYPETHGLMGNTVFFPQINPTHGLSTSSYKDMMKVMDATGGHLLTSISLGEVLKTAGQRMMVFSSGSPGQAFMQNHTISGGAIINPGLILPESFREQVLNEVGAIPPDGDPNTAQHKWITDALIRYGFAPDGPLVSAIWYSDPDGAAHEHGIGSPPAKESIRAVDAELGRILKSLKDSGRLLNTNIIISADHGFVSYAGKVELVDFLIANNLKASKESDDVIVVGESIYVKDHQPDQIKKIVNALMVQDWVGPIFTQAKTPGNHFGIVEGTLSFSLIHWNHPRSADIVVTENWDDEKNENEYPGRSFSTGVAGHGGLSPYEVHIPLLVSGPSFRGKMTSDLPTSNVDIAPTVLTSHDIPIPTSMTGRPMKELMRDNQIDGSRPVKEKITTKAGFKGGVYHLTLERTVLGKYQYVDFGKVLRTAN